MYHRAAKAVCVSILGFVLSCVVSPCVYAAGPRLINFTNPHIAKSKAGADNSREQFFNPSVHFCHMRQCVSAGPGTSVRIPGYRSRDIQTMRDYYTAITTRAMPPVLPNAIEYCGSVYFDEESGDLCACVSEYCHNSMYAMHGNIKCKHSACRPLIPADAPGFCDFLPGRKSVKFVPVSFANQNYFRPGIRVVSYTDENKGTSPSVGRNLYLNLEAGETKKEFTVTLLGSTYVIDVEKKMREDVICGTYKEGGANVYTECVPTPFLPKPTVYRVRNKRNAIGVKFPGCRNEKKCVFELRVGQTMTFPAALSAIIPVVSDDYMFEQYAKCPKKVVSDPMKVKVVRAGHMLCGDGSKPELLYLSGDKSNLRCLVINQQFAPSAGVYRDIGFKFGTYGGGVYSVITYCTECALHMAQYRAMIRTEQGRVSIADYARLAGRYAEGREVLDLLVGKTTVDLGAGERSLVSEGCAGFPDIPLQERQELLDALIPGPQGILYLPKDDIKRMGIVGNVERFCPDLDKVPMRYSAPLHKHKTALDAQTIEVGDPYEQGLCILASKKAKIHAASDSYTGPSGQREIHNTPKYQYAKSGIFKGCQFLRAELYEMGVSEKAVHLIKNLAPQDTLTAIFNIRHNSSSMRLQTLLKLCVGPVDLTDLTSHESSDCIILPAERRGSAHPTPYRMSTAYNSGNSRLEVLYSSSLPYELPADPPDSGIIKLHCVD